ncbi:hypothetical protein [Oceaniglobus ichthyenteri]|uniref:hypothetical protein n=1 Tax=Oceaniglobus ichthyenteri TaxID=2136177 RepID=UPI000D3605BC|nr:hypothetical protein [Oceaniglobus ichthyenteri]
MKVLAFLALLPGLAQAQETPLVDRILETARAECIADVQSGDPTAPTPDLLIEPGALTAVDLDGEGEKNDTIVDFNHILCSLNYSLWHGTGGSILHLVVNGERSASLSGGLWRLTEFNGAPLLLIGRHGGNCEGFGAQPCVQAVSVYDDGFSTVQHPELDETDGRP